MFVSAPGTMPGMSNFSFLSFFFSPLYFLHIKGKAGFLAGRAGPSGKGIFGFMALLSG